jgi:hypothetical protein
MVRSELLHKRQRQDLLSNDVVVMRRVDLERAVVSPQVDRRPDAGDAALVHLIALASLRLNAWW